ncbi:RNA polymerase sigma-28 (SigD/FliA/WhiG) subunit [Bacillus oleivorans]|uniref:RNA polymerase sigma factor n=1 Tax=Bacillus oleivorans TaxID=1448271 RepID=A0A285D1N8_9BACI|nr:FliA/WhiG family RNA polymerase sigma factor [Bacillus oleivorans]SNX73720.1 RNA polymerase sigma-28 (SigD/FliA/WhiG) subunit [Bacillus oleivorans]
MAHALTDDEKLLWQKWSEARDQEAGNTLIHRYMPLVHFHVQRISAGLPKNVGKDDLISLGMMGLFDAVERFDPNRDLKFDTYASFRIRGAIIDGLRKEDWLPRSTRDRAKKVEAASEKLMQKYFRQATAAEIAKELETTEEDVYKTMTEYFYASVLSIDDHSYDSEQSDHPLYVKDEQTPTPEESITFDEKICELANGIKELSEKEQLVLSLFYQEELTLTEIGQVMKLSTSRISQIHAKALYKLKEYLKMWM